MVSEESIIKAIIHTVMEAMRTANIKVIVTETPANTIRPVIAMPK